MPNAVIERYQRIQNLYLERGGNNMEEKNMNVKVVVFVAIIAVVVLSLLSSGAVQYLSETKLKEANIVEKSMISLQPILTLAARNINGANLMNLKNTNANDLYKTNRHLLYLKMAGKSAGSPKTEIFDKIPSSLVEHTYIQEGLTEEKIKSKMEKAVDIGEDGFLMDRSNKILIIHKKLDIKNGGNVQAIFSAEELSGAGMEVFKKVFVVSFGVLIGAIIVALFVGSRIAKPIDNYINNLQEILKKISAVATGVDKDAVETSTAVEEQGAIASQQSSSVSEITSTVEELSLTSTQIAESSQSVVSISDNALQVAEEGVKIVETVKEKMEEISQDNQNSIREVVELGKKSKEITKIMEIINNVADQSKLIAFNAAIEASSAGESGKRFGVVAVEIRRLADNVMESTSEIEGKINEIQEAINRLVINSEKGSRRVQEGTELSSQTASVLMDILNGAQSTTEAAKQISLSTQQQKTGSAQVVTALKEIAEGAKQSSASIKAISNITDDLTMLSNELKEQVKRFKS